MDNLSSYTFFRPGSDARGALYFKDIRRQPEPFVYRFSRRPATSLIAAYRRSAFHKTSLLCRYYRVFSIYEFTF
jgi:hypothetical protein